MQAAETSPSIEDRVAVRADTAAAQNRLTPQLVYRSQFPWPIAQIILQHHERLDGSGYPRGLRGEAILLDSKILTIADVVEAMTAHRPYRPALGVDVALAEVERNKGRLYDPAAVEACVDLFQNQGFKFQ